MSSASETSHLVTARVRNFPGYIGDVCLRILAGPVVCRPGSRRYRKVKAIAHDGREFHGWISSSDQNPMIVPRAAPLRVALFVSNERVTFEYVSATAVPDIKAPRQFVQAGSTSTAERPFDELWIHISAIIRSLPIGDDAAASRMRKAVALMFHSDASTNKVANEVLARANALIDSRSRQQAA